MRAHVVGLCLMPRVVHNNKAPYSIATRLSNVTLVSRDLRKTPKFKSKFKICYMGPKCLNPETQPTRAQSYMLTSTVLLCFGQRKYATHYSRTRGRTRTASVAETAADRLHLTSQPAGRSLTHRPRPA